MEIKSKYHRLWVEFSRTHRKTFQESSNPKVLQYYRITRKHEYRVSSIDDILTKTIAVGAFLKTMTPATSPNNEHERMKKTILPSSLPASKFGFQKFRLRAELKKVKRKEKSSKPRAELLDNQESGDHEDSSDETDFHQHHSAMPHISLIEPPTTKSTSTHKQKLWPF